LGKLKTFGHISQVLFLGPIHSEHSSYVKKYTSGKLIGSRMGTMMFQTDTVPVPPRL